MDYKSFIVVVLLVCGVWACPAHSKGETPVAATTTASVAIVQYDSSAVQMRSPADALARYRSDRDFIYERDVVVHPTLWEQFKAWLWSLLQKLISGNEKTVSVVWDILLYILVGGAALFVVFRAFGMTFTGAFGRAARRASLSAELLDENIHEMDFNALIEEAIQQELYRKAVRLLYLHTLKELADKHYIVWRREKTNREYVRELTATDMRKTFEQLTLLFEYIWYGDFPVDRLLFEQSRTLFANFSRMVVTRA